MKERIKLRRRELTQAAQKVMRDARDSVASSSGVKKNKTARDKDGKFASSTGMASGKRDHHGSDCSSMIADYAVVDMGVCTPNWSPTVLLRDGVANVFMEATAANFQALFDTVQRQLSDTSEGTALCCKGRKRRVSSAADPTAPIKSPRATRYWIEARGGWNHCVNVEASGGSGSRRTKRRLVRHISNTGAAKKRSSDKKRRDAAGKVLNGSDDESASDGS